MFLNGPKDFVEMSESTVFRCEKARALQRFVLEQMSNIVRRQYSFICTNKYKFKQ